MNKVFVDTAYRITHTNPKDRRHCAAAAHGDGDDS